MKIALLALVLLTGCSATTSQAYFNMAMANIAPGSFDVAVYNTGEIVTTIRKWNE